ncbi:MliC family protein [Fluviibacter phosphoraccumulans]|uniref:Uncharacterized protein n=1 Tax=Fluviibacter phosphoraccumulans TaxID=1751046 RepID=A0A679I4F0_9RHOO|nr:MliC family protein [Fluviibacter phosphoraccumulans]BBU69384.1 hypothetical protein ICHIAU1_16670 [Fluviibacter phosphoraccumulans]BBU71434.1 hypothetical protein ICHIJ1_13530 [Fluviibacter phosphoraccumulans]BCA65320.1 hypothetical protein SHINM1_009220 [Fluviibacter phosphoraccumulans]
MKTRLIGLLLLTVGAVYAQDVKTSGSGIEITHKPAAELPAQYKADVPKPRKPYTVRYTCPEAGRVYVIFDNAQQTATLEMGNTTRYLKQGMSASGARYVNSDESYVFWIKGKEATINGRETCVAD